MLLLIFSWPYNTQKKYPLSFPPVFSRNFEQKCWTSQKKENREKITRSKWVPLANLDTLFTFHSQFARKPNPHRKSSSLTVLALLVLEVYLRHQLVTGIQVCCCSSKLLLRCCYLNHSNQASLWFLGNVKISYINFTKLKLVFVRFCLTSNLSNDFI